jgi:hypothetical protein
MVVKTDTFICLDAYVSPSRDKIVLKASSWDDVRKHNAIMFRELENGPRQISSGQVFLPKGEIEDIHQVVRNRLLEYLHAIGIFEFDANITSAEVWLLNDYQKVFSL